MHQEIERLEAERRAQEEAEQRQRELEEQRALVGPAACHQLRCPSVFLTPALLVADGVVTRTPAWSGSGGNGNGKSAPREWSVI